MLKAREVLQEVTAFKGGRKDVDKKVEDMNEEEKAVFDVLEDEGQVGAGEDGELSILRGCGLGLSVKFDSGYIGLLLPPGLLRVRNQAQVEGQTVNLLGYGAVGQLW